METLLRDLRYAFRMLLKSPGFTMVSVLTLALGISANTAIFSVVDGALLRPLPYKDPDRLMMVSAKQPGGEGNSVSFPNFVDWRNQNHVFEHLAAMTWENFNLSKTDQSDQISGARVSHNFFDLLGVRPALGRNFAAEEETPGRDRVAILSNGLWQSQFGSDPGLIGQTIMLNREKYEVIGVMPPEFHFWGTPGQVWTPLALDPHQGRDYHFLAVFARLKKGIAKDQAQTDMDMIAARLGKQYPTTNKGWGIAIGRLRDQMVGPPLQHSLLVLLGAVAFVLLIACANVANLMLARGFSRRKEVAIRAALGAQRSRLMGQFLTESVLLAFIGGALGLILAYSLVYALVALIPPLTLPPEAHVVIDHRVLLFTLGITLSTGILFGSVPALRASEPNLHVSLQEGGRSPEAGFGRRVLNLLVISQMALALVLLAGAGLLIHSFLRLYKVNPGFQPSNVLTVALTLTEGAYSQGQQVTTFQRQVVEKVETIPGVKGAALATQLPLRGWNLGMPFSVEGQVAQAPSERPVAHFQMISPSYFRVMGIPLLNGRSFTETDAYSAPRVAIVNQTIVQRFFPNQDPIGKRLVMESLVAGRRELGPAVSWEIVGVIRNVKDFGLGEEAGPEIYVPYQQSPWPAAFLAVRTTTDPLRMVNSVKEAIRQIDKDQAVTDIRTMEQIIEESVSQPRFRTMLLATFAAIALALAAGGIYGVMSYAVTQRTHEIGIRMALGAHAVDVAKLVVKQGMILTLMGLGIGLAAAFALTRVMESLLYGVRATDPVTFVVVSLVVTGVALLASYLPARRATKVDPMVALRHE